MLYSFCFPSLLSEFERKGKEALHAERLEGSVTHLSVPKHFVCYELLKSRNFGILFKEFRRWIFFFLKKFWEIENAFHGYCILCCYCLTLLIFLSTFSFILRGFQFLHVLANHEFFFLELTRCSITSLITNLQQVVSYLC